ncbi:MAG: hypothetical protein K0S44_480 [Bacteroidetes bacterium]|jgi:PKD repeat protein|nr:hypothetical protein [Bacteroidota bacterium]
MGIYKLSAQQLVAGEYFIDTDPGVAMGTSFAIGGPADSVNNNLVIPTTSLAVGFHKLYVRYKDNLGQWGLHDEKLFYVYDPTPPPAPAQAAPIVAMEYFFDANDAGIGMGAFLPPFTPSDNIDIISQVEAVDPLFLTPLSVGTHTLNIRARDAAGVWGLTRSFPFTVCSQPAVASYTTSVSGNTVTFTNTSNNDFATKWIFGDGATDTARSTTHTYNNGGIMNVCMIAYSGCGNDTACQNVTLNCTSPTASFTKTTNNLTVAFTSTASGASSVLWNFGDGSTSTLLNPTHVFQNTGSYNVCLTTYNGCGSTQSCQNVSVTCAAPVSGFTYTVSGQTVSFSSTATNAYSFVWQFGNSTTNNNNMNPVVQYSNPGTYLVKLIVQNGCGTNIYQINVTVTCGAPTAEFDFISSGLSTEVSNTSLNGTSWLWDFGDGTTSPFKNPPIHNFPATGTYNVCLTATNSCGSNQICYSVDVCTGPTANFTATPSGTTINFTNTSLNTATSFWTFGNGYATNQVSPSYNYPASGSYNVCLRVTNDCGSDTVCQTIQTFCSSIMNQEICLSTVDTLSTHNIIYWEKPAVIGIDSFRIYREVTTNVYSHIASVSYNDLSEYHDTGANPNVTSYKYKMTVIDTCGNESVPADWSNYHNTIHLQNLGNGNLQWTLYEIEGTPNPVTFYRVYRDDLGTGNFLPISSTIPGGNTTYTDVNYATYPLARYRVDVAWSISCSPTRASVNTTRSNIKNGSAVATGIDYKNNFEHLIVYPNPAFADVTIEFVAEKVNELTIYNSLGQIVFNESISGSGNVVKKNVDISRFEKGIYIINIKNENGSVIKRISIQ